MVTELNSKGIEACLQEYPAIRECAVIVNNEQLIAYICADDVIKEEELNSYLKQKLPLYMLLNELLH